MVQHRIEYMGVKMDVTGIYTPGEKQTYDYPGSSHEFEVHHIHPEGSTQCIVDLLDEVLIDLISQRILDEHY